MNKIPKAGDQLHFLGSVSIPQGDGFASVAHLTRRGETITITDRLIEAARDRLGNPGWLGLVNDPDEQQRRWGEVKIMPGPAPDGMESWRYGDASWAEYREGARRAAHAETDPADRAGALAAVEQRYGWSQPTSRTIGSALTSPEIREAEKQLDASIRAGAGQINRYAPPRREA